VSPAPASQLAKLAFVQATGVFLYNTLTRRKEELVPREVGRVSLYVCGVTPYDAMHIGHARAFMVYDVLRRLLQSRGLHVHHVQNVTDVDDKIINRAAETGVTPRELADRYTAEAFEDLERLGIQPAHEYPRVTEHIHTITDMIGTLEEKGYAYARAGDVYFDVSRDEDYGKLSGQRLDELEVGARIDPGEHKDDPLDFALWKAIKPGEPAWASPWGEGRPGWHIECSAMALKLLGPGFDIHGGARELIFPHHENEVAQSESYLDGGDFARLWWHCGVVQVDGKKMSKSLGNFLTVRDALELAPANVWRLLFLMTHPRSPLDYSQERLMQGRSTWLRLQNALGGLGDAGHAVDEAAPSEAALAFRRQFEAALCDDLNTPDALAAIFDAVSEWHRTRGQAATANGGANGQAAGAQDLSLAREARRALETLGFTFAAPEVADRLTPQLVELLIKVRQELRERRDFQAADGIRQDMAAIGIVLEDSPSGTRWRVES